jgi:hypothetical protein
MTNLSSSQATGFFPKALARARIQPSPVQPVKRFSANSSPSDPITGLSCDFRYQPIQNGVRYGRQNVNRYTSASSGDVSRTLFQPLRPGVGWSAGPTHGPILKCGVAVSTPAEATR